MIIVQHTLSKIFREATIICQQIIKSYNFVTRVGKGSLFRHKRL